MALGNGVMAVRCGIGGRHVIFPPPRSSSSEIVWRGCVICVWDWDGLYMGRSRCGRMRGSLA